MWPDLAIACRFGRNLESFRQCFKSPFSTFHTLNLLWQILFAIGKIFVNVNDQTLKNNLAIWSHCLESVLRERYCDHGCTVCRRRLTCACNPKNCADDDVASQLWKRVRDRDSLCLKERDREWDRVRGGVAHLLAKVVLNSTDYGRCRDDSRKKTSFSANFTFTSLLLRIVSVWLFLWLLFCSYKSTSSRTSSHFDL